MYTLEKGRPENLAGRLEKEIRVYDFLDRLKIDYERIDHEAVMTMEACREIDRILDAMVCKNLFLCNHQKTEFYLLMLPGEKEVYCRQNILAVIHVSIHPVLRSGRKICGIKSCRRWDTHRFL